MFKAKREVGCPIMERSRILVLHHCTGIPSLCLDHFIGVFCGRIEDWVCFPWAFSNFTLPWIPSYKYIYTHLIHCFSWILSSYVQQNQIQIHCHHSVAETLTKAKGSIDRIVRIGRIGSDLMLCECNNN